MNLLIYEDINPHFKKNDMIRSLSDGVVYKYSGFCARVVDFDGSAITTDCFNKNLILCENDNLAEVVETGIDYEEIERMKHVENVMNTCQRLGCTPSELLRMDYQKELSK